MMVRKVAMMHIIDSIDINHSIDTNQTSRAQVYM